MKVLALADVHQSEEHWECLVHAVREESPGLVAIAGDLLPKYDGILAQPAFLPRLVEHAANIREAGSELVLIAGNDDNQLVVPELKKGDQQELWHYVPDRVKDIQGREFCGCPWINDYPFAYKYWVAAESRDNPAIHPVQLGPPALISQGNEIEFIPDLGAYLRGKPSIREALQTTALQVENMAGSIWLIHCPPANMDFDLCGSGDRVGSREIYRFIREMQPLVTVHGHIHEAPFLNGGVWAKKLGRTVCIQGGQSYDKLSYVTFNLTYDKVTDLSHSLFGSFQDNS